MEPPPTDKPEINALINDILAAHLEKDSDDALDKVLAKYGLTVAEAKKWMDHYSSNLGDISQANKDRTESLVMAYLIQDYGAIPGKDVSKYGDGVLISAELLDKMAADMSPAAIDKMRFGETLQNTSRTPYEMLEKDLGVPFIHLKPLPNCE